MKRFKLSVLQWVAFTALIASNAQQALAQSSATPPGWAAAPTTRTITERMSFASHGATLVGTLYRPATSRPVPAMVVLHDASVPLADAHLYDHLRTMLPPLGIALFVFDRRGTGASSGEASNTLDLLAEDGIAAAQSLQSRRGIDPRRIGFWGLSQGGWLSLLAGSRWKSTAFAISVSAPLVTPDIQMNFLASNILRIKGFSEADVAKAVSARTARDQAARGQIDIATARARVDSFRNEPWFKYIYMGSPITPEVVERWGKDIAIDPAKSLTGLTAPTLFIFGALDPVEPVAASIERLQPILRKRPNVEAVVVAGADHSMTMHRTLDEQMDPAANESRAVDSAEYLGRLANWLQRQGLTRAR